MVSTNLPLSPTYLLFTYQVLSFIERMVIVFGMSEIQDEEKDHASVEEENEASQLVIESMIYQRYNDIYQ